MKKILFYIITLIGCLAFTSCNDFLNEDPDARAQLNTPQSISKLLATAYPQMATYQFFEVSSDNVEDNYLWNSGGEIRSATQNFWWQDVDSQSQDTPTGYWSACYEAIAAANQAIQFIEEKGTPSSYSAQYGEALVCRAYAHFMLSIIFCNTYNPETASTNLGIPYVTEPETTIFKDYERGTLAKTYELIEKDLLKGLPLISDGSYTSQKYHFNASAANAFASRFFLFKQDWQNAADYASEALGSSPSEMLRDWTKYKTLETQSFQKIYSNYEEPANLILQEAVSVWTRYYRTIRYVHTKKLKEVVYGSNITGGEFMAVPNYLLSVDCKDLIFTPKFYEYFKYESINATIGWPYLMVPLFTAEEILLNRAEAYAMLNNETGVIADLNTYYSKRIKDYTATYNITSASLYAYANRLSEKLSPYGYTLTPDQEAQIKVIVDSRRKEFLHEGNRWYDIKRFNIEVIHKSYSGDRTEVLKKDDLRRVFQVPQQAIAYGLEANPR